VFGLGTKFVVRQVKQRFFSAPIPIVHVVRKQRLRQLRSSNVSSTLQRWLTSEGDDWLPGDWQPSFNWQRTVQIPQFTPFNERCRLLRDWKVQAMERSTPLPKTFFPNTADESSGSSTNISLEQKLDPRILEFSTELHAIRRIIELEGLAVNIREEIDSSKVYRKKQEIDDAKEEITEQYNEIYDKALISLKYYMLLRGVLATSEDQSDLPIDQPPLTISLFFEWVQPIVKLPLRNNQELNNIARGVLRAHAIEKSYEVVARLEEQRRKWVIGPCLDRFFLRHYYFPGARDFLYRVRARLVLAQRISFPDIDFIPYYQNEQLVPNVAVPRDYPSHYRHFLFRGESLQTILDIMAKYTFYSNRSEMERIESDENYQHLLLTGKVERAYISSLLSDEEKTIFYRMVGDPTTWMDINAPYFQPRRRRVERCDVSLRNAYTCVFRFILQDDMQDYISRPVSEEN
jgi:hypothetical protein